MQKPLGLLLSSLAYIHSELGVCVQVRRANGYTIILCDRQLFLEKSFPSKAEKLTDVNFVLHE